MDVFLGKWQIQSVDKHEELMALYGVPDENKPAFRKLDAVWAYSQGTKEDTYHHRLDMGGLSKECNFCLGNAFDDKDIFGNKLKTMVLLKGGRLVESYQSPNCPDFNYTMSYELIKCNNINEPQKMNLYIHLKDLDVQCVLKKIK